jgi:predicted DNA-binding antitoxin AbrB/MazE fold protein
MRRGRIVMGTYSETKVMTITFEAIYENGVLRPIQPLALKEQEQVRVTVEPSRSWADATSGIIGWKGSHEELVQVLVEAEEPEPLP